MDPTTYLFQFRTVLRIRVQLIWIRIRLQLIRFSATRWQIRLLRKKNHFRVLHHFNSEQGVADPGRVDPNSTSENFFFSRILHYFNIQNRVADPGPVDPDPDPTSRKKKLYLHYFNSEKQGGGSCRNGSDF